MNVLLALVVTICAWMTFSVLNELQDAKYGGGCCKSGTCGTGFIAESLWWMNLVVALIFTLYILYRTYNNYGGRMPREMRMAFGD